MMNHKHWQTSPSSQSGFTIIESLVAILVVSILLAAIAPVIVLSVATRVQAKRIETATDAVKNYIDGVRSGTITPPASPITDSTSIADYAVPTADGTLSCGTGTGYCTSPATNLYCVSVDGGNCTVTNTNNFVIQAVRYNQATVTTGGNTANIDDPKKGYQLGIRVYRADGFASAGGVLKKAATSDKQATFAAGVGDRKTPLVEMTTEITKSVGFSDLCTRLRPNPAPSPAPSAQSNCS